MESLVSLNGNNQKLDSNYKRNVTYSTQTSHTFKV